MRASGATFVDGPRSPPIPNEDPGDELNAIALDASKARKELEWTPTADIAEGIRRTMRWLCATLESEAPAPVGT